MVEGNRINIHESEEFLSVSRPVCTGYLSPSVHVGSE